MGDVKENISHAPPFLLFIAEIRVVGCRLFFGPNTDRLPNTGE